MTLLYQLKRLTYYRLLRHVRKSLDKRRPEPACLPFDLQDAQANLRIKELIESNKPCMIARFGSNELSAVNNYLAIHSTAHWRAKMRQYLKGIDSPWWWDDRTARQMISGAGFFPPTHENLEKFAIMSLEDCQQIDVLGSWLSDERHLLGHMPACRVPRGDLEPYWHKTPWTSALRGRKVLVVHPFADTICHQYARRETLFDDPDVLPSFDLTVLQAVQSVGGNCERFSDWFGALAWMKEEIAKMDFDVAIIGAGAYGMPLAAFIKRDLGKQSVHLGGASQLLFGIKGRRWDKEPLYAQLYKDTWVRPSQQETPPQAHKVEGACYW